MFVCFATKSAHLEVVSDLITDAFLAALKRFIARKRLPKRSFRQWLKLCGAANELHHLYNFLSQQTVQDSISHYLSSNKVSWHFNPDRAPHFSGLWEALIKSMKFHLKRVMGDQCFTYKELTTVTCRIEACLNSRPLLPISSHSNDGVEVLTLG